MAQPGIDLVSDRTNRTGASGVDPLYDSHASTIVQASDGDLLMAYFNGGFEGANNQSIYVADRPAGSTTWSAPVAVAGDPTASYTSSSLSDAMYNPVLFQPAGGPLFLYYKQGTPQTWVGYYKTSTDSGHTWSAAVAMPTGYSPYSANAPYESVIGPSRSKPIQLADGTVLFGSSLEYGSYAAYIQRSTSITNPFGTGNWTSSANIDPLYRDSIQPTFLYKGGQTIEVLTRMYTGSAPSYIGESVSTNDGVSWTNVQRTPILNNWSGIEGQALSDGRYMLFCNPDNITSAGNGRNLLVGLISSDGTSWHAAVQLESVPASTADEFDYPAAIQASNGLVQITYSNNHAGIRNVTLDPTQIKGLPMNTSNPTAWQWPAQYYNLATSPAYANLAEDDANSNSGYITKGSALTGNSFGYQTTQHAEGYSAGEIGGTFSRTAQGASFLGRSLGGTYNQNSSLIATGQLYKTPSGTTDLYLGFFNSTDTSAADFIGLDLSGSTGRANIIDSTGGNGATITGQAAQTISNSTAYQYSMIWTPARTGPANLSITLANGSNSQLNWSLSGAALSGFTGNFNVDSFGLFSFGDGNTGSMQAYIDDDAVGATGIVPEPCSASVVGIAVLACAGGGRRRRFSQ